MKKYFFAVFAACCAGALFAAQTSVIVSVNDQKTYIYEQGTLVRTMVCSTGVLDGDNDTPLGDYIINRSGSKRGEWFFSQTFQEGAKYWVGFIGGVYLFHSVPMDAKRNIIPHEAARLGVPASHGCIRLTVDDAKWFYESVANGSEVHIVKDFKAEKELARCVGYKGRPIPQEDMFVWLSANGKDYKQKYLLSCEIALIRTVAALSGITGVSEDDILKQIPRGGSDPERYFVCADINGGRRGKDGSILWNNYGAHAGVVLNELKALSQTFAPDSSVSFTEEKLEDAELRRLIVGNRAFRGAIVWVVGHPERWGKNPPVNERGMVLGEHVRFVLPALASDGSFLIYDPESGAVKKSASAGEARSLFANRTVCAWAR